MSDYTPDHMSEDSIEETRRKKLEEFNRTFDRNAIRGAYDEPDLLAEAAEPAAPEMFFVEPEDEPYGSAPADLPADSVNDDGSVANPNSSVSYSTDDTPLKRRRRDEEINSFSNSDAKKRIERDSKKALKQQKKEEKRIEKSKAKRNRRVFRWAWLSMVLIIAIMVGQYFNLGANDMLARDRADRAVRTVSVTIPADPTVEEIADILCENGIIDRPGFFRLYTRLTSSENNFRQGTFELTTDKDYEAIVNALQSEESRTDFVKIQITEGMSIWEITVLLYENEIINDPYGFLTLCNSDAFDEDYPFLKDIPSVNAQEITVAGHKIPDAFKLEGYLFPDTYIFYKAGQDSNKDNRRVIDKMLSNYEDKIILHKEKYFGNSKRSSLAGEAEKSGYTIHEILTIASIIQAEAANKEDMYNISSILHNRLEYGASEGVAKLNCDCTLYYPWREKTDIPESLRDTYASRYDTNTFEGLPPGPICNPGAEAIKAALKPYDTEYLYFCHDTPENDSVPYYATTLEEHNYYLSLIGQ